MMAGATKMATALATVELRQLTERFVQLPSSIRALEHLNAIADRHAKNLVHVVRNQSLKSLASWPNSAAATIELLLSISGWSKLAKTQRFLSAKPHEWARFTEPQITGGWRYFLATSHSLARCQAAIDASWLGPEDAKPQLSDVKAVHAELGKIDLLILGQTKDQQTIALCIEAKFGHVITEGQLNSYEGKLVRDHGTMNQRDRILLIIAPKSRSDVRHQQRKESEWLFLTWKQWLIRYENALLSAHDDSDFQRFRRTTFERARLELCK